MPELFIVITNEYGIKAKPDDYVLVIGRDDLKRFIGTPHIIQKVEKTKRVKLELNLV